MLRKKNSPTIFPKSFFHRFNQSLNQSQGKSLNLSSFERTSLKIYIWHRLYQRIRRFHEEHSSHLLNGDYGKEIGMNNGHLVQYLIKEIVATEEYTLDGIARYVHIPLDVVVDLAAGIHTDPSLSLSSKIIDLYISVKRSRYNLLIKKLLQCLEPK